MKRFRRLVAAALMAAVLPTVACTVEERIEAQGPLKIVPEMSSSSLQVQGEPTVEKRTIGAAGLARSYTVSIPPAAQRGARVPLIFVFHGYKGDGAMMRSATGFDRADAVVVYMDGKDRAWAPAPYATTTGEQDLAFFDEVRAELSNEFDIDPAGVFAAGLSNGGGFAAYVGCHRPQAVTAVATVSAAYYERVLQGCSPIPVKTIDFHGTSDDVINYNGGLRHNTRYESSEQVVAETARRNHCFAAPVSTDVSPTVTVRTYQQCDAPLAHYRIDGGGHVWPGAGHDTSRTVQPDFATTTILDFFGVSYR